MGGDPSLGEDAIHWGREAAVHCRWENAVHRGINWTSHGVVGRKNLGKSLGFSHSTWSPDVRVSMDLNKQIILLTSSMCGEEDKGDIDSDSGDREWTTTWLVNDYSLTISWLQLGCETFADTQWTTTWLRVYQCDFTWPSCKQSMTFIFTEGDVRNQNYVTLVTGHKVWWIGTVVCLESQPPKQDLK